jgi:hypothetical protein
VRGRVLGDQRAHLGNGIDATHRLVDLDAVAGRKDYARWSARHGRKEALARVDGDVTLVDDVRDEVCLFHDDRPYRQTVALDQPSTEVFLL